MKKLFKGFLIVLCALMLVSCASNNTQQAQEQTQTEVVNNDVPKDQQEGTAGSNIPLKDNLEEAKYQIEVAMQYQLEQMFGDKVNDARIYVEEVYSAEDEQADANLKALNLNENEVAFRVRYELHPAEGVDVNEFLAGTGTFDKESGWVTEKYNVGVLRPNPNGDEPKYVITDFGTAF